MSQLIKYLARWYIRLRQWRLDHYSFVLVLNEGLPSIRFYPYFQHLWLLEREINRQRKHLTTEEYLAFVFAQTRKIPELEFITFSSKNLFIQYAILSGEYWFNLSLWKTNLNHTIKRRVMAILKDEGYTVTSSRVPQTGFTKYKYYTSSSRGNTEIFANTGSDRFQIAELTQRFIVEAMQKDTKKISVRIG